MKTKVLKLKNPKNLSFTLLPTTKKSSFELVLKTLSATSAPSARSVLIPLLTRI